MQMYFIRLNLSRWNNPIVPFGGRAASPWAIPVKILFFGAVLVCTSEARRGERCRHSLSTLALSVMDRDRLPNVHSSAHALSVMDQIAAHELFGASSDAPSSADEDASDADLLRILEETDDPEPVDATDGGRCVTPERRRAELDRLLQRADDLVRSATASLDEISSPLAGSQDVLAGADGTRGRDHAEVAVRWESSGCAVSTVASGLSERPSAAGRASDDGRRGGADGGVFGGMIGRLPAVHNLADAEAAERQRLQAGQREASAPLRSRAGSTNADERRRLGLGLLHVAALGKMADELAEHLERGRATALTLHGGHLHTLTRTLTLTLTSTLTRLDLY